MGAYEGWLATGCPKLTTNNDLVYQRMAISNPSADIKTYQCEAAKTGCYHDSDCHIGGAIASQCYCYGASCIDTGDEVSGTDMRRSKVRGNKSGKTKSGVNNACTYHIGVTCRCHQG